LLQSELLPYVSDYTQSFNKILQPPFCVVAPFFKKITFYYSARKSEIDWTRRKNETFYFTFLKDFFTTGCLGFGSRKSLLHTHTDIPKCVRGPPEEGGCLLKKASPLLFFFSFPIHHHQHFTQLAWCVVQQRALHFLLLGKREESR
jgi:hypothetical protein